MRTRRLERSPSSHDPAAEVHGLVPAGRRPGLAARTAQISGSTQSSASRMTVEPLVCSSTDIRATFRCYESGQVRRGCYESSCAAPMVLRVDCRLAGGVQALVRVGL